MDMSTMTMVGVAVAFMVVAVGVLLAAMIGVRWVARRADPPRPAPMATGPTDADQEQEGPDQPGQPERLEQTALRTDPQGP